MTATNHALTGAIIGVLVVNPLIALPLAFCSHFALDAIPHFGVEHGRFNTAFFRNMLITDAAACVLLAALITIHQPAHWWSLVLCAFVATSPDLMWIKMYWRSRTGQKPRKLTNPLMLFHSRIQWFQRSSGAAVELAWFVAATTVLFTLIK
jgi:hypothetical protein